MNVSERSILIARLGLLLAFTLIIQMAGLPQPITGPLINTVLYLSTWMFGPLAGFTIGCMTPVIALLRGQLPPALAPMMPFIIVSNIALVLLFFGLMKKLSGNKVMRFVIAILSASLLKMGILYSAVVLVVPWIIGRRLPVPIEWMMSLPQFLTAVTGGAIFVLLLRWRSALFSSMHLNTYDS